MSGAEFVRGRDVQKPFGTIMVQGFMRKTIFRNIVMARLRFPGRPGHRFDRISVRYFADDVKNISDPAIAFLPQFKRGLQLFRELVGESDEVKLPNL